MTLDNLKKQYKLLREILHSLGMGFPEASENHGGLYKGTRLSVRDLGNQNMVWKRRSRVGEEH